MWPTKFTASQATKSGDLTDARRPGQAGPVVPVLVAAVLGWSWFVAGLTPFAAGTTVAVLASGLGAVAVGARWWAGPAAPPKVTLAAAWPWLAVAGVLAVWQLVAFAQAPRDDHPTISSLTNAALDGRAVRAAAFAGWLLVAAWLGRR
jgi:hypothetical protein